MAKDIFHKTVINALKQDGWVITDDPYRLDVLKSGYEIDLGAEKLLGAEKGNIKIAVEIKSFLKDSFAHEFHGALGQYINYRLLLSEQEPDRILYLAVTQNVFSNFFVRPSTQFVVQQTNIKILVFNSENETVEQWIEE